MIKKKRRQNRLSDFITLKHNHFSLKPLKTKQYLAVFRQLLLFAALFTGVHLPTARGVSPVTGEDPGATLPLKQSSSPVVLAAGDIPQFTGIPIERLGLFRFDGETFSPIPFQVDERNLEGQWVFPNGIEKNPSDGNGRFDGRDELVFMARDSGQAAPAAFDMFQDSPVFKIKIDIQNGGTGFVYLISFTKKAPRSPLDYARYHPETKSVITPYYKMGFHPDYPIGIGYLAALPAAGGDGSSVIDRMKVRVKIKTIFGIDFSRSEEDFSSVEVAYIDGPVRVIRRSRNRMAIILSIPSPPAQIDNIFYRDSFSFPTEFEIPFDISGFITDIQLRTSIDLTRRAMDRTFFVSSSATSTRFDGTMSPAERQLAEQPFTWMAQLQTHGNRRVAWLNRLIIQNGIAGLKPRLYYNDQVDIEDPPEGQAGHFGDTGFMVDGFYRLEAGVYRLVSFMYCIPDYQLGMEKAYLDMIDLPPAVSTTRIR